jgi:hypothetical protein
MEDGRRRDPENDDAPYLPERYRRQVAARKQRRLIQKILIAGSIVVMAAVIGLVFLGTFSGVQQLPTPTALPVTTPLMATGSPVHTNNGIQIQSNTSTDIGTDVVTANPTIVLGSGLKTRTDTGMVPPDTAISLARLEFPAPVYTIARVNLTDQSGRDLYEFVILNNGDQNQSGNRRVFIDAFNGEPYTLGQESAKITPEQVKRIASTAFPYLKPDQIRARYLDIQDTPRSWNFLLVKENTVILSGSLDAETGQIISFTRPVSMTGRPADPVLSLPDARKIADQMITGWNGPLPINMSSGQYESPDDTYSPAAGQYIFKYNRIVQDMPCDEDGFTVGVDSVSGNVTSYERRWSDPDSAFSVASQPVVTKREATFAILRKIKEIAPETVNNVRILSAQIQWKDRHAPGVTPRPGTISLAWKVTFDDDIRASNPPVPATGWVDAQTGAIIDMEYQH